MWPEVMPAFSPRMWSLSSEGAATKCICTHSALRNSCRFTPARSRTAGMSICCTAVCRWCWALPLRIRKSRFWNRSLRKPIFRILSEGTTSATRRSWKNSWTFYPPQSVRWQTLKNWPQPFGRSRIRKSAAIRSRSILSISVIPSWLTAPFGMMWKGKNTLIPR